MFDGSSDRFGAAAALAGDTALVGASGRHGGPAHVYERLDGDWSHRGELVPVDGKEGNQFGYSVALADDTALVGAPDDEDPNGEKAGTVYVFERTDGE